MPLLSRRLRTTLAVLSAGVTFAAVSAGSSGCTGDETTIASACPPGKTCQTRLTILHTSDVHSRLFPYDLLIQQVDSDLGLGQVNTIKNVGGIARVSYILGRERARADRLLHLDSGDYFEGAPIFNFFSGEPEMRAASAIGTDAMALGNHEFDRGAANAWRQIQQWADFPVLAANYRFVNPLSPTNTAISTVIRPFTVFNREGLKIAVIGMGNLSSLGSIFDDPNGLGIKPLETTQVAQFYVDLLRPYVDLVVMLTHLGLDADEHMVHGTTGIDFVIGGHNHIVISPPQQLLDCSADPNNPGFIWAIDPNLPEDPNVPPPNDATHPDPVNHPYMFRRPCIPRKVLIQHSGAFAKYVGRLDLILSNDPKDASPTGNPKDYDPLNGFEVLSDTYQAFPIDDTVPEDPPLVDMLQPYRRVLDRVADLDILTGFSPSGARRIAPQQGDSPLGNLISAAMWLRLGVQTDFSMTNSTGIRTDLNPGPVTIEEMYNIFPFDNTITKMTLSGREVLQLFDFVARRSAGRGCDSQAQIAGARVVLDCSGCNPVYRPDTIGSCNVDSDCTSGAVGACDLATHQCLSTPCAEQVYIGHQPGRCTVDSDCPGSTDANGNHLVLPGQCDVPTPPTPCMADTDCPSKVAGACNTTTGTCKGLCQSLISPTNLYELATNNYIAGGGSGYRVLQRNTTQIDTKIPQRDAVNDYMRNGKPCGFNKDVPTAEGLPACSTDGDCSMLGDFVCACPGHASGDDSSGSTVCTTQGQCDPSQGRCVLRTCRDQVAQFHEKLCAGSPALQACLTDLNSCSLGGEECKFLSCVDESEGAKTDNRITVIK